MQCKQYLYRVSFHKLNNLLILNVYITHLWNNRCSYFRSKEGYFASIFSFPGIYISFYANRRHIQVVETVNDRWMWLKSYKLFKNLTERSVPRELFENWKTLTCDVNAVPLCSTLQYVFSSREQRTLCFISSNKLLFKIPQLRQVVIGMKFQY